ncbi:hypothetical protein [Aquimarina agarilytica]|uniref:hypothetical protein n=1 Tax=Aquimarina agarilytica TaxID=1087449 RepID=UPI000289D2E8|nr:hypothetical protein [Aquimarina agarilytica]
MITGETEQLLDDHFIEDYDDFFGNKKKRRARRAARKAKRLQRRTIRRSAPKRIERRAKRKQFFKDVGQVYNDIGGATAIGAAIDSFTRPKLPSDYNTNTSEPTSDYSIDVGAPSEPEEEKKGFPTVVYVLGGVVVVGVIGLAVMSSQKNKSYQSY